jgi:transposase
MPDVVEPFIHVGGLTMTVTIGIDPHKRSHTAVAVDDEENEVARTRVIAGPNQLAELNGFAASIEGECRWAIEAATGVGLLLAQQFTRAGIEIVDVPPTLAARVRLLASGRTSKTDRNDAHSIAVAAIRHPRLRAVSVEDHVAQLRLLVDRHMQLTGSRTQLATRLHALFREVLPGGARTGLKAHMARDLLDGLDISHPADALRRDLALELIADMERLDAQIKTSVARMSHEVNASNTTLLEIMGCGPITAALILSRVRTIDRFPNRDHFASYNGTAPLEASSGDRRRHRLNPKGNRTLNRALHVIAVCQVRHPGPGRDYYDRKLAEGKTKKEALRALKRQVSNVVWRHLVYDAERYR